ncbi:MAG: winged helix-turn-helix transcriptional regulator [Paracoccaceae bacterium]|nr:MAG: winged helix-turn-helix transcriptional regulator [Paracoccaceae bacterium]
MVERIDDPLSDVLKAAGDPTRRAILTHLAQNGPTRVTEIADRFAISLNAISRHIMVLERAGLVSRRTVWRAHYIAINLAPLAEVDHWFAGLRSIWALRLEALGGILEKETADGPGDDSRTDDDGLAQRDRPPGPGL